MFNLQNSAKYFNQTGRFLSFFSIGGLLCIYNIGASSKEELKLWSFFNCSVADNTTTWAGNHTFDNSYYKICIPHSFNCNENIGSHTKGFGWYTTSVKLNADPGEELFLEFGGVALRCKVFIDGNLAGENNFAYLPFRLPVKSEKDSITIAVQVDNRLLKNDIPDISCNGWWIYGGLIREVSLVRVPVPRIENCQVRTTYSGKDSFQVYFSADTVHIKPDSIELRVSRTGEKTRCFKVAACDTLPISGITPWSPETPVLYDFTITPFWKGRKGEAASIKRGFSHLYVRDAQLWLNGRPIFLRGVGRHDVGLHSIGHGLTRQQRLEDLKNIKALGANMLRIAHFPQHRDIYELCDSIGLIVMDEMPAWKSPPDLLGDTIKRQKLFDYMDALIDAHGNHTSIGIWCVGNEINGMNYSVGDYIKTMADFMKKSDPSRMFTYTSFFYQFDKAFEYADVVAINEYFGWYVGSVEMLNPMFRSIHEKFPDKPIIVTEFGAAAALGIRNPKAALAGPIASMVTKDFSEDYQALLMKEQIKTIWNNHPITGGAVVWCYNDFMENRKMPNPKIFEKGLTGLGIVTEDRKKKLAYSAVKAEFESIRKEMLKDNGY
jgi:beta-glucuronidase